LEAIGNGTKVAMEDSPPPASPALAAAEAEPTTEKKKKTKVLLSLERIICKHTMHKRSARLLKTHLASLGGCVWGSGAGAPGGGGGVCTNRVLMGCALFRLS